jgi:hypothetical protein
LRHLTEAPSNAAVDAGNSVDVVSEQFLPNRIQGEALHVAAENQELAVRTDVHRGVRPVVDVPNG